ncbi:MAG: hypothetical protein ACKOF3_09230 [Spartobacteria bacterium]
MAPKRQRPAKNARQSLYSTLTGVEVGYVPKRWVKFPTGILLLLPCVVLTLAFYEAFLKSAAHRGFLLSEEFSGFAIGGLVGLLWFFSCTPLRLLYVMGHELTHALWVWIHGGRVHDFHVRENGGHVVTDRTNTLIILAPYFFPFYTLCWVAAYGFAMFCFGLQGFPGLLYFGLGFTWFLHLAYTVWMIQKGQPDLEYGGAFFSLTVIYLANLSFISAILVIASPSVTWKTFASDLLRNATEVSAVIVRTIELLTQTLSRLA